MDTDEHDIRGVWTRGSDPKELVLSDGSRLRLGTDLDEDGGAGWRRTNGRDETSGTVSVPQAVELAGEPYAGFVQVRTRAEAEWLRAVAEWCSSEAAALDRDLATALR